MANGHVEIHDPFPNHNGVTTSNDSDAKSPSDGDSMADTAEFRLMMAYATRRRPPPAADTTSPNSQTAQSNTILSLDETKTEKKKKMKGWKRLGKLLPCVKPAVEEAPQTEPRTPAANRCLIVDSVKEEDEMDKAASRLTSLADEIPFTPPEIETDTRDDDVEKAIGLLLRETGDRLNDKDLDAAHIAAELFWKYSFFEKLMDGLLIKMGLKTPDPEALGPKASPKTQIAVTCEVASRLSAVNTLPMNLMLNHGAKYLQEYYSSWVQQNGGYEEAFYSDDEDDEE